MIFSIYIYTLICHFIIGASCWKSLKNALNLLKFDYGKDAETLVMFFSSLSTAVQYVLA